MLVPLKLIYNDSEQTFLCPTTWADVKFCKLLELQNSEDKTVENAVSIFTGIPLEHIKMMGESTLSGIANLMKFLANFEPLTAAKYDNIKKIDVRQEAWGKIEACKIHLRNLDGKHEWNAAVEIIKTYADIDISDMASPDAVAMASFFLSRLKTFSCTSKSSRISRRLKMNWLRGSKTLRNLGTRQPSTGLLAGCPQSTMQSSMCQPWSSMTNYCSTVIKTDSENAL